VLEQIVILGELRLDGRTRVETSTGDHGNHVERRSGCDGFDRVVSQ
jgi:hypothetical protein